MRIEHRVPRKKEIRTALMNAGYTVIQWSHSDLVSVKKDKFNETFISMRAACNELINSTTTAARTVGRCETVAE